MDSLSRSRVREIEHETKSEFTGAETPEMHETESEFTMAEAPGMHETKLEFDEFAAAEPREGLSNSVIYTGTEMDVGAFARLLLEGLRRAAGARG